MSIRPHTLRYYAANDRRPYNTEVSYMNEDWNQYGGGDVLKF